MTFERNTVWHGCQSIGGIVANTPNNQGSVKTVYTLLAWIYDLHPTTF